MEQKPRSFSEMLRMTLNSNWFYLLLLGALILFPYIVGWITGDSPLGVGGRPRGQSVYWQSIFIEVFIFIILAISYNLMFGFTGVISFGHALFFGMGGYGIGILLEKTGMVAGLTTLLQPISDGMVANLGYGEGYNLGLNLSLLIASVIAVALAGVIGLLMGLVSLRLKGVYFAIFTLAVSEMAFIYVGRWSFTNAEDGFSISQIPEFINPTKSRLMYYYIALLLVVAMFLFIRRLMNSPTGRVLLAIRENEDRAQSIGYDTLRYKLFAITLASMMASVAGIMHVLLNKKVGPEIMSTTFTIEPLIMTIIGGVGTFTGPVIGASLLHLSERILNREFAFGDTIINVGQYWALGLGIAFIVVVLIFPQGVVGTFQKFWHDRRRPDPVKKHIPHEDAKG